MRRSPKNPFANEHGIIVMAHRGGSRRWPENTMLAFQHAADLGVDGLELDVHSTADGVLVVIHDDHVDRVTDGHGFVHDLTLAELKQLDAGYHWTNDGGQSYPFRGQGVTIPTLAEVFAAFPDLWINIDLKQSDPSIVEPFVALLHESKMTQQVCVGSFDEKTVRQFRQACPEAATAASLPEALQLLVFSRVGLDSLYQGRATAMQLPEVENRLRIITPGFVRAAHRRGIAVHVWTVDDISAMQRLIQMGVDGLITDYPDLLLKLIGR